jgi:hypothetical protein
MKISGKDAASILAKHSSIVQLHRKDNTNKFWSYKLKSGSNAKFAFNPSSTRDLFIRFDQQPPNVPGVDKIESLNSKSISSALDRVFSGRQHKAKFKALIFDEATLLNAISKLN